MRAYKRQRDMLPMETPRTFSLLLLKVAITRTGSQRERRGLWQRERKMRRCIISAHINRLGGRGLVSFSTRAAAFLLVFFCVVHFAEKRVISGPVLQIARSSGRSLSLKLKLTEGNCAAGACLSDKR